MAAALRAALVSDAVDDALAAVGVVGADVVVDTPQTVFGPSPPPACSGISVSSAAVNMSVETCVTSLMTEQPLLLASSSGEFISVTLPVSAVAELGEDVRTVFYALSWDPHESIPNTTGVTHLEFLSVSNGSPFVIDNLPSLITFELPRLHLEPGTYAAGAFWNDATKQYSTTGMVSLPNPAPPEGVSLIWDDAFNASADDLSLAWKVTGPAADGCRSIILNCSEPEQRLTQLVSLDPEHAIGDPSVGCGQRSSGTMRIIFGHECTLWRYNSSGCYWNATLQIFDGAACVASERTALATRHLTDFMAAPAIQITVATTAQLAPSSSDLARLRFLITVLVVLFASMCIGAYMLSVRDAFDSRILLASVLSPEFGCRKIGDLWTWRLTQKPMDGVIDAVEGSAIQLAGLLGFPYVRLAAALPENWLCTSVQSATGRRDGLSATAFREHYDTLHVALRQGAAALRMQAGQSSEPAAPPSCSAISKRARTSWQSLANPQQRAAALMLEMAAAAGADCELPCSSQIASFAVGGDGGAECDVNHAFGCVQRPSRRDRIFAEMGVQPGGCSANNEDDMLDGPDTQELVSTALLHAVMLGYCIESAETIATQQSLYLARLCDAGVDPSGTWFLHLFTVFKELVIAGVLGAQTNWWPTARLARIVLLSNPSGYWDADSGVAAALLANSFDAPQPRLQGVQRLISFVQGLVSAAAAVFIGSASSSSAAEHLFQSHTAHAKSKRRAKKGGQAPAVETPGHADCPLAFSEAAIAETIPAALATACVESSTAVRIWTTALVVEVLLTLKCSWRATADAQTDVACELTLADTGARWLDAALAGAPAELLPAVRLAAAGQVADWAALHERLITASRSAFVPTALHKDSLEQRACGAIFTAAQTQHATIRLFAADQLFGGKRHQHFMVLITSLIAGLTASIWLYYSRAQQCCSVVRTQLGCDPNFELPCHGYTASCQELASTYFRFAIAALSDASDTVYASPGLQCESFPDPKYPLHTFVAGLISFACCTPVAAFVSSCFSLSVATDDAQLHSRTRLMRWTLPKRVLLGRAPWRYRPGALHRLGKRLASSWCTSLPEKVAVHIGDACMALAVRLGYRNRAATLMGKIDTPLHPYDDDCDAAGSNEERDRQLHVAAALHDRITTAYKHAGYLLVLVAWAVCTWMILVYGALIYRLLGPEAEATFTRSWGIGVGIGQLDEARGVIVTAAQTALALLILEALWLAPNSAWLENTIDDASVHATILRAASVSLTARVRTYARFNKAVV
jgi:hypothetical protein